MIDALTADRRAASVPRVKAVILYFLAPEAMPKLPVLFPKHKEGIDAFHARGELLAVGTWADPRDGAMGVFRTRAAAEAFVAQDPFVLEGVVARYEIKEWNEILL